MTAITEAPVITEAGIITRAEAALAAVRSDAFPWPSQGGEWVVSYAHWLADDLETYGDVAADRTHPTSVFPDLEEDWPDDAKGQALERLAEDLGAGTRALIERARRFCGDEGAAFVLALLNGSEEGKS